MSLIEKGQADAAEQRDEAEKRAAYWEEQAWKRLTRAFYEQFWDDHYTWIENPDRTAYSRRLRVIREGMEVPGITLVKWLTPPNNSTPSARFTCDGVTFEVEWEYHSGGDRAYWDDGWWVKDWWVLRMPRRGFGWLLKPKRCRAWSRAQVAEALS